MISAEEDLELLELLTDDDPEDRERIKNLRAIQILAHVEASKPGRGHMYPDEVPRPAAIPPRDATLEKFHLLRTHETRMSEAIGVLPAEFDILLEIFENSIRDAGGRRGGHFKDCKYPLDVRLCILLHYLRSNDTMDHMETEFNWASSSIHEDIVWCCPLFLADLKEVVEPIWPTPVEQNQLVQLLPTPLREQGIFLFLDKHQNRLYQEH